MFTETHDIVLLIIAAALMLIGIAPTLESYVNRKRLPGGFEASGLGVGGLAAAVIVILAVIV